MSLIYEKRAILIYWEFLESKASISLTIQKRVIEKATSLFSKYEIVILGDREFCSVALGNWLKDKEIYFCLRQKKTTNLSEDDKLYQEMQNLELSPRTSLFLNDVNITKMKGFDVFNLARKSKKL